MERRVRCSRFAQARRRVIAERAVSLPVASVKVCGVSLTVARDRPAPPSTRRLSEVNVIDARIRAGRHQWIGTRELMTPPTVAFRRALPRTPPSRPTSGGGTSISPAISRPPQWSASPSTVAVAVPDRVGELRRRHRGVPMHIAVRAVAQLSVSVPKAPAIVTPVAGSTAPAVPAASATPTTAPPTPHHPRPESLARSARRRARTVSTLPVSGVV